MEDYKEKIRNLYNKVRLSALLEDSYVAKKLEEAFPELKEENEDERIMKALIHLVNSNKELSFGIDNYDGIKWSDILAWLENRCQTFTKRDVDDAYLKGICDAKHELEKQCEQKSYASETMNEKGDFDNGFTRMMEKEQKATDKVEPKFISGNWYQCVKNFLGKGVHFDKDVAYYCAIDGCLQNEYGCHIAIVDTLYDNFKLWNANTLVVHLAEWIYVSCRKMVRMNGKTGFVTAIVKTN